MRVWAGPIMHQAKNGMRISADCELTEGQVEFIAQCIERVGQHSWSACYVEWDDEGGPITVGWRHRNEIEIRTTTIEPRRT